MPLCLQVSFETIGSFTDVILVEMVADELAFSMIVLVNVVPGDILYFHEVPFWKLKYELWQGTRLSGLVVGVISTLACALATCGEAMGAGKKRSFSSMPAMPIIDSAIITFKNLGDMR